MKRIIAVLFFLVLFKTTQCQIVAEHVGWFSEYDYNWGSDSVDIKFMLDTFNINISKLKPKKFFDDLKFSTKLQDNNTYIAYTYFYNDSTGTRSLDSFYNYQKKPLMRKYLYIRTIHYHNNNKSIDILIF